MRFVGQAFEISVDLDPADLPGLTASDLAERFTAAHRRVYFHGGEPDRQVEIVGLRFGVRRPREALPAFFERPTQLVQPPTVTVRIGADTVATPLLDAAKLGTDAPVSGPALLEGYSSSTWVPPGWTARRDRFGNIRMQREPA
jgi:N-methylhydantoinase A